MLKIFQADELKCIYWQADFLKWTVKVVYPRLSRHPGHTFWDRIPQIWKISKERNPFKFNNFEINFLNKMLDPITMMSSSLGLKGLRLQPYTAHTTPGGASPLTFTKT